MADLSEILPAIQDFFNGVVHSSIFVQYGLAGLFANGVLSATILPIPTEIATSALLSSGYGKLPVFLVLAISSTVGGFLGYYVGRSGNKLFQIFKGKPNKRNEDYGDGILRKYGWIAIFGSSWIPIIGDLIPIIAGTKKYNLQRFAIALAIGKVTKAIAIVYLSSYLATRFFGLS
jgi:membrane protein YqaA with SNARE-associated domain